MDKHTDELDQWDLALEEQVKIVQECQEILNITSCSQCSKILECTIRKEYVKAVYESMNKGAGGGFEF